MNITTGDEVNQHNSAAMPDDVGSSQNQNPPAISTPITLPSFPSFEVHADSNAGPRWRKWLGRFERLLVGLGITDPTRKRALLLHYAGFEVDEIFETLSDTGTDSQYDKAVEKLNEYFSPKTNTAYEVYMFRQAKQRDGESLDTYHTRLRQLAKTCGFTNVDKEIAEHITLTCISNSLRRRALRDNYDLTTLLKTGRAFELSEQQARQVEKHEADINSLAWRNTASNTNKMRQNRPQQNRHKPQPRARGRHDDTRQKAAKQNNTCRNCGGPFPHATTCPAKGQTCNSCGKSNHWSRVCRSKPKQSTKNISAKPDDNSDSEDAYVFTVINQEQMQPHCQVDLEGHKIEMMIDSGANVNLLDEATYKKINEHCSKPLKPSNQKIFAYGSATPLPLLGIFSSEIRTQSSSLNARLHVIKGNTGNLMSYKTATKLGLIKISVNNTNATAKSISFDPLQQEFQCLFDGIGKVKDKIVKLHIDPNITPKQQPHRRIPFHVRKDVEKELQRLEALDIIEEVEGPTPWVSPIVVVPKPSGQVRLCVDMREANKAIKREKHIMPTIDDLIADLSGATVFSKLDLSSGYHQFVLDPECRHITTFSTHVGLRRYKRLMFGVNAASEIFQNKIEELLTGLPGCKNISDDIIVFGETQESHDQNLRKVFKRLKENNVRLNKEKCVFSKSEVMFYGHIFSANGIKADPKKIDAIKNAPPPQNISEVKSLLGMAQYVSRFIPGYASLTAPLRSLTKQNNPWKWEEEEQQALRQLQDALTGEKVMSYFDPRKETEIIVDASPVGLGGLLMQEGKVISYASRALSDVESRYSQTEREMLATVWGAERFHLYVYGAKFSIVTDHKPLLGIFNGHKLTSTRIDRWKLRLMPYNCELIYRPGRDENNPADFISRHPSISEPDESETSIAESYINYICSNAVPKAMTLHEVQIATKTDQTLQAVTTAIETGQWSNPLIQDFKKVKDELSNCNGVILRGNRIVLPDMLKSAAVDLAHGGHQGIVKTKSLIREKIWFPGIDGMVEEKVKSCLPCQAATQAKLPVPEPLNMTPLPTTAWKEVSTDFVGPFPSGEYLLVVTDSYSRFPEVEITTSTSARTVIPKIDAIFARQGIPDILKSDNGPPFNSYEFKQFAEHLGFKHRRITPYWPRANGEAERFMKTIEKCIRAAHLDGKNWKQEMYVFLRHYRATPHTTTGISPSEALNNRKLKTSLPELPTSPPSLHQKMQQRDKHQKEKMKSYADSKARAQESSIKPGQVVLLRQRKQNKFSTPFNPKPLLVKEKKGSMVTASNGAKTVTRNSSLFKVIPDTLMTFEDDDDSVIDEPTVQTPQNQPTGTVQIPQSQPTGTAQAEPQPPPVRKSNRPRKTPVRFSDFVSK